MGVLVYLIPPVVGHFIKGNAAKPGKIRAFVLEALVTLPGGNYGFLENLISCLGVGADSFGNKFKKGSSKLFV